MEKYGGNLSPKPRTLTPKPAATRRAPKATDSASAQARALTSPGGGPGSITLPKAAPKAAALRRSVRAAASKPPPSGRMLSNLENLDTKSQRKIVGMQYPSGKQSSLGALFHANARTKTRDGALAAFDAYQTGAYKHDTLDAAVKKGAGLYKNNELLPSQTPKRSSTDAAVLTALDQTTRPLHAVAGAADAAITGKNVLQAASRGIQNKDHVLFSKVLKDLGAPKIVQSVGGFTLDVAADPTTYVTFGAASVAKKAAEDAARSAAAKAAKAGMSEAGQATVAKQAYKRAAKAAAGKGKGVTVKLAGREVPGVTRATAKAGRGAAKVAGKAPQKLKLSGTRATARNLARDVRPTMAPAGIDKAQFARLHDAEASARGDMARGQVEAQAHARALQKHVKNPVDHAAIIHALETKTIGKLPEHLRQPAIRVRSELRHAYRKGRRSGLGIGNVEKRAAAVQGAAKGYVPHAQSDALHGGEGAVEQIKVEGVGRRAPSTGSMKHREDVRTVKAQNAERPGKLSTDLPLIMANHLSSMSTATARAKFNRTLASVGRHVSHGASVAKNEALYVVKGANIHEVRPGEGAVKGGHYVAIDRALAERSLASVSPISEATTAGHLFNQANKGFKRVATFTPGFHVRNAIGDTQMAYLSQPGHRLVVNTAKSARVIRAARAADRRARNLEHPQASGKTIKLNGKRVAAEDVLKAQRADAAIQTGYIGRELDDLVGRKADGAVKKVRRGSGVVTRLMHDRENLMRGATYLHQIDKGAKGHLAGRTARDTHIDYGDLTPFERQARRVMPFYTFTARSVPLHIRKYVTNPGKFANYQKIREEAAAALGLPPGYENSETAYQQQQAGVPISIGGHKVNVGAGLPLASALSWLPAGKPAQVLANTTDFLAAMVTPFIKVPVELKSNKSFFTHNDIQNRRAPLVAAPDKLAEAIYKHDKKLAKTLGIVPDYTDAKGRKVWGWYGRSDYVFRQFPGPFNVAKQLLTTGTNQAGQGHVAKAVTALTGIKPSPIDPPVAKKQALYKELDAVREQLSGLSQRGIKGAAATAERKRLNARQRQLQSQIYDISLLHGDKLPSSGAPPKSKAGSGWGSPGGGSSSSSSGWGAPGGGTTTKSKSGWG